MMASTPDPDSGILLTEAQVRARRRRSVALGLAIAVLCLLFYLITVFRMGSAIVNRSL